MIETNKNDEVLAVYVKGFELMKDGSNNDLGGHLKVGGVYLCYKHQEEDRILYRVFFNDNSYKMLDGIFLKDLKEENDSWKVDLEVIDLRGLDEYKLSEEELDYVLDISTMSPEEAKRFMEKETGGINENGNLTSIFDKLDQAILEATQDIIEDDTLEDLNVIPVERDGELVGGSGEVLAEITDYLLRTQEDKYSKSPIDTMGMIMSEEHGKSVNVFNSIKYLSRYVGNGGEKNGNRIDLFKSIHYLIFELTRTK